MEARKAQMFKAAQMGQAPAVADLKALYPLTWKDQQRKLTKLAARRKAKAAMGQAKVGAKGAPNPPHPDDDDEDCLINEMLKLSLQTPHQHQ